MSNKALYILWGVLYALCFGLGFIEPGDQRLSTVLTLVSIGFFVPGFVLLARGHRKLIRIFSTASLGLTLGVFLLNVLVTMGDSFVGDFLYVLLGLVSVPMFSSRFWLVSLFLWACLLMGSIFWPQETPKTEN